MTEIIERNWLRVMTDVPSVLGGPSRFEAKAQRGEGRGRRIHSRMSKGDTEWVRGWSIIYKLGAVLG